MYKNKNNIKNFWPVPRKGTKYVAISLHNKNNSIPLLVVIRDILKLVKTAKELKRVLNEKQIKINGKVIKDVRYPTGLFDIISINDKTYKYNFNGKKVFLIAPLHNHFQALGWPPYKVTMRYWIVGAMCGIVGVIITLIG